MLPLLAVAVLDAAASGAQPADSAADSGAPSPVYPGDDPPSVPASDQPTDPRVPAATHPPASCDEPASDLDPDRARTTAYGKALQITLKPTTTMTLGLVAPKRSTAARRDATGGRHAADGTEVLVVEVRAELTRGSMDLIWNHDFSMLDPEGKACHQLDPGQLPGVELMNGQDVVTQSGLTARLAFEVPRGADPADYTVYFHHQAMTPLGWSANGATDGRPGPTASSSTEPRPAAVCPGPRTKASTRDAPASRLGSPGAVVGNQGERSFTVERPRKAAGAPPYWLSSGNSLVYVPFTAKALAPGEKAIAYTDFTLFDRTGRTCRRTSMMAGHALIADSFGPGTTYRNKVAFIVPSDLPLKRLAVAYSDRGPDGPADRVWK